MTHPTLLTGGRMLHPRMHSAGRTSPTAASSLSATQYSTALTAPSWPR